MTLQEFYEYLDRQVIKEDKIVYMRYKYSWETEWTYSNEILEVNYNAYNCYIWLNDWNEGQEDVEILGCIAIDDVDVPEFESRIEQKINSLREDIINLPEPPYPEANSAYKYCKADILEIIDKYRESEDKE